jgi:esterase
MLHYENFGGSGPPDIVFLHGLFGSARNFASLAANLNDLGHVHGYDARNHGRSSHFATHSLQNLTEDLGIFLAEKNITSPVLVGHSMGGLTAMNFARTTDKPISALVLLDIAPRTYIPGHEQEIAAQKLDLSPFSTRREIDEAMQTLLPNGTVRQFLQTNIDRDDAGRFYWTNNISGIENSPKRTEFPEFSAPIFRGPVMAIRGLRSTYVSQADVNLIQRAFPAVIQHDLPDGDHWLHYTHQAVVIKLLREFLKKLR